MLPPKIMLISPICSSSSGGGGDWPGDVRPDGVPEPLVLQVVASSCDLEKFCTLSDRVLRYDGSRTTFLHRQGDGNTSSLSNPRTTVRDSRSLHDLLG
jgi:hypothetical protein